MTKTIATGNWGCGAFGGDFELKFLQQWLAASYAGVEKLYYYTFRRTEMSDVIKYWEKIRLFSPKILYDRLINADLIKGQVLEIILDNKNFQSENLMELEEVDVKNINSKKKDCCWDYCNIY